LEIESLPSSRSPGFSQVLIPKEVKGVCFDTLLQVLILKVFRSKGRFCAPESGRGMPPPVFLSKSAQAIENKGSESEKKLQESLRVRKPLKREDLIREHRT
jgi:hypothetical protein